MDVPISNIDARNESHLTSGANIYQLLSNSRRRQMIWCLATAGRWEMPLQDVASHVVAYQQQERAVEVPRSDATDMFYSLKRYHLGPLVKLNVLTVDEDRVISPGPRFFEILPVLVRTQRWECNQKID